ncbi:MAG: hypothetical protein JJU31_09380 [Wenzhouxiangella sp.]|nr:hypothetical protein [Wenzhouxiangella sp.]
MTASHVRWEAVIALFDALLELPEAERQRRLEVMAVTAPELVAEVAAMLAADQREPGILETTLALLVMDIEPISHAGDGPGEPDSKADP